MIQEQKKFEKHPSLGNIIKFGILTLAVTSAYRLLFSTIKYGCHEFKDGEESAPITTKRNESYGWRIVKQTLRGKRRGGRVITKSYTIFRHEPNSDIRTTSQKLGAGKRITLTDGTTAEGE